jgi:predicted transposase/invertase (TIGR01784 family)
LDEQQRRDYESWEMELHQRASMVKSHYGRGHREGLAKGLEKGLEKGREEGRGQGREETTAEFVRNLLQIGMPAEQVAGITGLSVDKIRSFTLTKS